MSTRPARACRSLAILLLAGGAIACTSPAAADETKSPCLRPNDSLWLVSHRGLGCRGDEPLEKLHCWRFEKSWERASLADLLADDCPDRITTLFVHGNRIDGAEAFTTGFRAYQALVRCASDRPVRFVIWSWPSERVCGPVNDARIKAARTAPSARYLARLIDRLDSTDRLSLWGHSFGARVVAGALDLLAGGRVGGRPLAERVHPARKSVRAVLVVAAIDNTWLLSRRAKEHGMSRVEEMLLVNNCCDRVLKRYHLVYHRRSCQQALGYTGLGRAWVRGANWGKIEQVDASGEVGCRHTLAEYLCAPRLMAQMRSNLLFESPAAQPEAGTVVASADKQAAR